MFYIIEKIRVVDVVVCVFGVSSVDLGCLDDAGDSDGGRKHGQSEE